MDKTVILIGVGQIGGVFSRGLSEAGYLVRPVKRGEDLNTVDQEVSEPAAVIVAVGEKDLQAVLESIPLLWTDKIVLVQNELLPRDWENHIANPTVISVWFEKKPEQDVKVIMPSPVFGPQANLIRKALNAIDIECTVLEDEGELLQELVLKNVYILTVNIAGLKVGGTVGELWSNHRDLARAVANDVMDIQFKSIKQELSRDELIDGMVKAFKGDLKHKCMGRSAPARLQRAIAQADRFGLDVNTVRDINVRKAHTSIQ